jgi:hypothetical protein
VTKGTAPNFTLNYNALTNRITSAGFGYDAAGNMTNLPGLAAGFDALNRVSQTTDGVNGTIQYAYGANNLRLMTKTGSQEHIHFYGPAGRRLGTYLFQYYWEGENHFEEVGGKEVYFAGRPLKPVDRLGSVRVSETGAALDYYPYGQEKPSTTAQNRDKFATYYLSR